MEFYRRVQAWACNVNLDLPGGKFFMPLFVKLREGRLLDEAVIQRIRNQLRRDYSPRHVPDKVYQVQGIPYDYFIRYVKDQRDFVLESEYSS